MKLQTAAVLDVKSPGGCSALYLNQRTKGRMGRQPGGHQHSGNCGKTIRLLAMLPLTCLNAATGWGQIIEAPGMGLARGRVCCVMG